MSSKSLELEKLSLTLVSEKLKLEIASTVDIKFPSGRSPPDHDCTVKALHSRNIWVSRGRRCRVDADISFNGKPLHALSRIPVLESLGYHLRNAHIWSQLSLSTSLEISQSYQNADPLTDMSIYINHAISSPETEPKPWLLDNIDIKAPDSVLCAEFERLNIQLRFHQIRKKARMTSKRVKPSLPKQSSPESMLLGYISGLEDDARLTFFENVAAVLPEELSSSIAKCFDESKVHGAEYPSKLPDQVPCSSNDKVLGQREKSVSSAITAVDAPQRRKRQRYPKETVAKLQAWLDAHPGNMTPSNAERMELMKQTGLERIQICNWFSHARRRKKLSTNSWETTNITKPLKNLSSLSGALDEDDEDILLSQFEDEMLFDEKYDDAEEGEMLLSQTVSRTSSSTSQLSTISSISSINSLKRPAIEEVVDPDSTPILTTLPLAPSNKLASLALQTVIAGSSNRKRDLQGIQMGKPPPSTSISAFVPSMFSPGFKELMAHNSKFLPTISDAICSSWVRNVQGVVLRQKLVALSNAKVSEYHDGDGEDGSAERLVSVVQARLWRMLQRTLYDEDAAKKLWKKNKGQGAENPNMEAKESGDEDLLGENRGEKTINTKADRFADCIREDFMDDNEELLFEDLLAGGIDRESDDGLLDYFEDQERLAIEAETEGMLFGSGRDRRLCNAADDEDELLLLGDGR